LHQKTAIVVPSSFITIWKELSSAVVALCRNLAQQGVEKIEQVFEQSYIGTAGHFFTVALRIGYR
jgi:hypothetical protein